VLDQHVLKATSSPDQRDLAFAGFSYHGEHRFGLSIRTAWTHDHRRQVRDERGLIADGVRCDHAYVERDIEEATGVIQGGDGCVPVPMFGREVHQNGNIGRVHC
jgi:hypothetical protein